MKPRVALLALIALLIIGYGAFEARRIIAGPQLELHSPQDGSATSSATVLVSGRARNIAFLTINGKPSFTDEEGEFSVLLSPPPGYAIFTVAATDRFGRSVSREVQITMLDYCPIHHG